MTTPPLLYQLTGSPTRVTCHTSSDVDVEHDGTRITIRSDRDMTCSLSNRGLTVRGRPSTLTTTTTRRFTTILTTDHRVIWNELFQWHCVGLFVFLIAYSMTYIVNRNRDATLVVSYLDASAAFMFLGSSTLIALLCMTRHSTVSVDGQDIFPSFSSESDNRRYSKTWTLVSKTPLETVQHTGSGTLSLHPRVVHPKKVDVHLTGSGEIRLCDAIENAVVSATGSGDVDFQGASVKRLSVHLTGSGDVEGFLVAESAELILTGSGDIKGQATQRCRVRKSIVGSGDIHIRRVYHVE